MGRTWTENNRGSLDPKTIRNTVIAVILALAFVVAVKLLG